MLNKIGDLLLKYQVLATLKAKQGTEKLTNRCIKKINKKNRWFIADISNFDNKSLKWEKMAVWAEKVDDTSSIYKGKINATTDYVGNWLWQRTNCLFGLKLRFYLVYPMTRIMVMYIKVVKWSKWFIKRLRLNLALI